MQKFNMVAKSGGKMFFCKKSPVDSADILRVKNCQNLSILLRFRDKRFFFLFYANSRWPPKVAGKRFLGKVASRLCRYYCISPCFQDKCVLAFYAEIQDGRQKWRENVVLQKKHQ